MARTCTTGNPDQFSTCSAKPMLPLLGRIGHRGQAHLRHGHLRDVDEHLQITALARDGRGGDCRLQVGRRHAHAEVHPPAATRARATSAGTGEVAETTSAPIARKRLGTFVLAVEPARGLADCVSEVSPQHPDPLRQRDPAAPVTRIGTSIDMNATPSSAIAPCVPDFACAASGGIIDLTHREYYPGSKEGHIPTRSASFDVALLWTGFITQPGIPWGNCYG